MKKVIAMVLGTALLAGCSSDADIASYNLSKAAESFEVNRRIIFFNGITDSYLLSIEGLCSMDSGLRTLKVTCKVGNSTFKRHRLGLSDNVSYFSEQLDPSKVSAYHYRIIFKPQSIIPDIDLRVE